MAMSKKASTGKSAARSAARQGARAGAKPAPGLQKAVRPSAELAAIVGRGAAAPHGDYQEALGLHQSPRPAGCPGQTPDQRGSHAAADFWRETVHLDVRAGQAGEPARAVAWRSCHPGRLSGERLTLPRVSPRRWPAPTLLVTARLSPSHAMGVRVSKGIASGSSSKYGSASRQRRSRMQLLVTTTSLDMTSCDELIRLDPVPSLSAGPGRHAMSGTQSLPLHGSRRPMVIRSKHVRTLWLFVTFDTAGEVRFAGISTLTNPVFRLVPKANRA